MKTLKKVLVILLVLSMVFSMTACGDVEENPSDVTPTPDATIEPSDAELFPNKDWEIYKPAYEESVEIAMWFPNSATSAVGVSLQELVDKFNAEQEAEHPGKNIKVVLEFQGTNGALNTKLQASILANTNPVITGLGFSTIPIYSDKLLDLRTVHSYDEIEGMNQGLLQYSLVDGKFVADPYFTSASNIIVANKTLVEASGFTLPEISDIIADPEGSNWTWDEFKKITEGVTNIDESNDENSVYGFVAGGLDPVGMMYQQGGQLYNSDVTEIMFDKDDKINKGLEFWRSLVTDGSMRNPNSRANHGSIISAEFMTGKAGMIYTTSSNMAKFTKAGQDVGFEVVALPFPKNTDYFVNQGGSGIIMLNNKPEKEIAAGAEFLRWLNLPENNASLCAATGYLPMVTEALETDIMTTVYAETPTLKDCAQLMAFGKRSPQGSAKTAVDSKVNAYAKQIWSEIDKPIADIVKELIAEAEYEIEANS